MALVSSYYGTIADAHTYFEARLHEHAWSDADPASRVKALRAATQIIDALNFKGFKAAVWTVLKENELTDIADCSEAVCEDIRAAEVAQELEFPRGEDTEVPELILKACFEITHALLEGKDPEIELENLSVISDGISSVRTTYNRNREPQEHIINGVPSVTAWRLLRPYLRDGSSVRLNRVS